MHTEKAYWLPSHVRACSTATGTVLLDLRRNRYFGVGRKETTALRALAGNWQHLSLPASFASDTELLPGARCRASPTSWSRPGCSAIASPKPPPFFHAHAGGSEQSAHQRRSRGGSQSIDSLAAPHQVPARLHVGPQLGAIPDVVSGGRRGSGDRRTPPARPSTTSARSSWSVSSAGCVRTPSRPATTVCSMRWRWSAFSLIATCTRPGSSACAPSHGRHTVEYSKGHLLLDANPEQVCEYTPILAI